MWSLKNSFCELTISNNFLNFLESSSGSCSISNKDDKSDKDMIIWYNFAELWEMPWIPFFNPHGESIDVFI